MKTQLLAIGCVWITMTSTIQAANARVERIRHTGVRSTWLLGPGEDTLNSGEINLRSSFVLPAMQPPAALTLTPAAMITLLGSPKSFEIPDSLFRFSAGLTWSNRVTQDWDASLAIEPGISTDMKGAEDAFRLSAAVAANYAPNDLNRWTLGLLMTGREDLPVLPLAGVTLTPNPDTRIELLAPRPRYARRFYPPALIAPFDPSVFEHWVYFLGELGGGTWAVQREAGHDDLLTLRDFRLAGGFEVMTGHRFHTFLETGVVFSRKAEYASDGSSFQPSEGFLFQAGLSY